MKKRVLRVITAFAALLSIMLVIMMPVRAESMPSEESIEYLRSIMEMVDKKYSGEVSEEQLLEGALKGIFSQMDAYTTYFTSEEADIFMGNIEGSFEGIGVYIEKSGDSIVITDVISLSPAEKAGLMARDVIVSVDGKNVKGCTLEEVVYLIKGPVGTKTTLGILRGKDLEVKYIEVERGKVIVSPVTLDIIEDIGYIRLEMFTSGTMEYFTKVMEELEEKKITKVILDLRNNPGGQLDQAVSVARFFVPEGLITTLTFKDERLLPEEYYSTQKESKYKLVVLVNENSASASEIVAGAVQDREAGIIVGKKTFGKAKVQNLIPVLTPEASQKYNVKYGKWYVDAYELSMEQGINIMTDEILGWIKMTTGMYLTPKGRLIDGYGITPDIEIDNPDDIEYYDAKNIRKLSVTWKPDLGDEGSDVYFAEKMLKLIGYEVDEPDTILDEKTFKAINDFRTNMGLYPGGVLDFTTQKTLNNEYYKKLLEIDKQLAKAVEILSE
ncbi:MAG TPA: S41 family peptidase [Clostridiaceae bacterium]|nr:S41 family peptidase [Clostridiaceae bacterium]